MCDICSLPDPTIVDPDSGNAIIEQKNPIWEIKTRTTKKGRSGKVSYMISACRNAEGKSAFSVERRRLLIANTRKALIEIRIWSVIRVRPEQPSLIPVEMTATLPL
ncbi:hypothetical protein ABC383_04210 [Noviherbaspirillum sp. 1P10PC]|uniref:hypothetical protein n=1 Tax=Noviherbaspirillum sp. 1P10PC TaxID=3132292 RepID=UPI0039A09406